MSAKRRNARRGFTIVEVMAVVVIIGLLAAMVATNFMGKVGQAKETTTKASLRTLDEAVTSFYMDTSRYPTEEEGLMALVEQPSDVENYPEGGYLKSRNVPKDAWGNEFVYIRFAENSPYEIISYGADGQEGGEGENADLRSTEIY